MSQNPGRQALFRKQSLDDNCEKVEGEGVTNWIERLAIRRIEMNFLKKHWGSIAAIVGPLIGFLVPSINSYAGSHPKTLASAIALTGLAFYNSRAPKDKAPTSTGAGTSFSGRASLLIFALIFFTLPARAQTPAPAPAPATFSLTASAIALPGGGQTVAGADAGMTFTPTPNFDLRYDTLMAPASNFSGFYGGFNYRLPVLSTKLNNASPNLNGMRFQFYLTASAGVDRISATGPTREHYSFLAGGGVNYDLTSSGSWTFGVEVRYAKLPGIANNTAIVAFNPTWHF